MRIAREYSIRKAYRDGLALYADMADARHARTYFVLQELLATIRYLGAGRDWSDKVPDDYARYVDGDAEEYLNEKAYDLPPGDLAG